MTFLCIFADLTMSVLGNESGLMSSFLSSEEIGELLDKVSHHHIMFACIVF